jgi:hypothetical protein
MHGQQNIKKKMSEVLHAGGSNEGNYHQPSVLSQPVQHFIQRRRPNQNSFTGQVVPTTRFNIKTLCILPA